MHISRFFYCKNEREYSNLVKRWKFTNRIDVLKLYHVFGIYELNYTKNIEL